jgi:hypothetical protein
MLTMCLCNRTAGMHASLVVHGEVMPAVFSGERCASEPATIVEFGPVRTVTTMVCDFKCTRTHEIAAGGGIGVMCMVVPAHIIAGTYTLRALYRTMQLVAPASCANWALCRTDTVTKPLWRLSASSYASMIRPGAYACYCVFQHDQRSSSTLSCVN